jgi:hypothetical protein
MCASLKLQNERTMSKMRRVNASTLLNPAICVVPFQSPKAFLSTPSLSFLCRSCHHKYPPPPIPSLVPELRADELLEPTLRSFPRPLIPLLLFLYRLAKYSHSSLSAACTISPSLMEANLVVRARIVAMWNLFWCDCVLRNGV